MSKYYHLKIKEVTRETDDAVSLHFWHPWNEVIRYKPGQYLTVLWPDANGDKVRRSYSLSSSPYTDVSPAITVKRLPGGVVSNYLVSDLKEGDTLEVMQPAGTFCLVPDADRSRTVFLLAAGSGITPLLSIAKSVLMVEPDSHVILLYGNRRLEDVIFRDALVTLKEKYGDRLSLIYALTQPPQNWEGLTGRLTPQALSEKLLPYRDRIAHETSLFFVCGQDDFMTSARSVLEQLGAAPIAVHTERFVTQKVSDYTSQEPQADSDVSPQNRQITLRYEGEEHSLEVAPHQSVLEAALELDIDLPYSCQAGMCTACLGRVLQGQVSLDEYDALTDAEIKEGFILTCVAHPQSADVIIEVE